MTTDDQPRLPPNAGNCAHCGQALAPGTAYCPHCGAAVVSGPGGQGVSRWRDVGAFFLGCLGLISGGIGSCLVAVDRLDPTLLGASVFLLVLLCVVVTAACIYGFITLIRKA